MTNGQVKTRKLRMVRKWTEKANPNIPNPRRRPKKTQEETLEVSIR